MLSTLAPSSTLRRSRRQYRLRSCCVVIDPAPSSTLRRPRRRHRLRNARYLLPTKRCASLASHKELGPALRQPMATEIWNDIWNGRGGGRTPTSPKKRRPLPVLHDALSPRPRLSTVSGLFAPTQLVRPVSRAAGASLDEVPSGAAPRTGPPGPHGHMSPPGPHCCTRTQEKEPKEEANPAPPTTKSSLPGLK